MATAHTETGKKTTSKTAIRTPAKKSSAKNATAKTPVAKKTTAKKPAAKKTNLPKATNPAPATSKLTVIPEERYKMIAAAAYLRAERRGFAGGHALDDWIAAEAEIDAMLKAGSNSRNH